MKKSTGFLLLLLTAVHAILAAPGVQAAPGAQATLQNGGLEEPYLPVSVQSAKSKIDGVLAQGWQDNSAWADVSVHYAALKKEMHGGQGAQRVVVDAVRGGAVQIVQPISLHTGRQYQVSVWLRGTSGMAVEVQLRQQDAPYLGYLDSLIHTTGAWQQVSLSGTTAETAGIFCVRITSAGTLDIDDAQITSVPTASPPLPGHGDARIPSVFFGMHVHRLTKGTPWPAVPIGTLRLWDTETTWAHLEPQRGHWNFSTLDKTVAIARQHGAELLLTLGQTPAWASARPTEASPYFPGAGAEPANIDDWREYVRQVATRYQGKIRWYEIWNEPSETTAYTGTVKEMVALTRAAAPIIRKTDPSAGIVSPSATTQAWLDEFLSQGGARDVDVIGFHFYVSPSPPEAMAFAIRPIQQIMVRHGLWGRKPLWDTEAGWLSPPFPSDGLAEAYVARAYLVNWLSAVDRFYWYGWDNTNAVTLHLTRVEDSTTLTPAGRSYSTIQKWLTGARLSLVSASNAPVWVCRVSKPGLPSGHIVWSTQGSRPFSVPAAWHAGKIFYLDGASLPLALNKPVTIGPSPLLFAE